jgi:hypothetical protein
VPQKKKKKKRSGVEGWVWWYMLVILATPAAEVGRSQSKASLGKSMKPYLKPS